MNKQNFCDALVLKACVLNTILYTFHKVCFHCKSPCTTILIFLSPPFSNFPGMKMSQLYGNLLGRGSLPSGSKQNNSPTNVQMAPHTKFRQPISNTYEFTIVSIC